jgi:hypothetical protein
MGLPWQDFCYPVLFENFADTGCVADSKSSCDRIVRATSVLAFYYQNANAKSEFAYLRANISRASILAQPK